MLARNGPRKEGSDDLYFQEYVWRKKHRGEDLFLAFLGAIRDVSYFSMSVPRFRIVRDLEAHDGAIPPMIQ